MSGNFALAAEQAKQFRNQWAHVFAALDYLATLENPADLEANIKRLKADSQKLIASYREQGEAEAKRNMQAAIGAAGSKAKSVLEDAEAMRSKILAAARAEAAVIISDARKQGEELTAKFQKAHAAAQSELQR